MSQTLIVCIYVGVAFLIAGGGLLLSYFCSPKKPGAVKASPYECGMPVEHNPKDGIDSRFYFYGLMFLVFDVELIFLLPWALSLESTGLVGFYGGLFFIFHIVIAFVYEIRKGALSCR